MKALAQTLFEISCTQDFQDFFQREIIQKGGITQKRKKNTGHLFFMRNPYMKFQETSIHRLKVKKKVVRTHGHAQSNMPYQLFQSWGHKNTDI